MNKDQTILVVAATMDANALTLYKDDGTSIYIPQGDERMERLVKEIMPITNAGGKVEVSLHSDNAFATFEENNKGFVRFFRVAKNAVKKFFGDDKSEGETLGKDVSIAKITPVGVPETNTPNIQDAVNTIMENAVPTSAGDFQDRKPEETIIAVVEGKSIIPDAQNLKNQFDRANKLGSSEGVKNFLKRISVVIDKRRHSIQDLLIFMEKGDLPIADDGSIVIYKVLRRKGDHYVDIHSGTVPQKVGSYVCMDVERVDHDRRVECSNGLHVARRGYLSIFPGDVCVIAKVAPEDVIAVPERDPHKMRVCGYHILFELSDQMYQKLKRNESMTSNEEAQKILGKAIAGEHVGKLEKVHISKSHAVPTITPLTSADIIEKEIRKSREHTGVAPKAESISDSINNDAAPKIDPNKVAQAAKTATAATKPKTERQKQALHFYESAQNKGLNIKIRKEFAQALLTLKKKTKVSYESLGLEGDVAKTLTVVMAMPDEREVKKTEPKKKAEPLRAMDVPKSIKIKASAKKTKTKLPENTKEVEVAGKVTKVPEKKPDIQTKLKEEVSKASPMNEGKQLFADLQNNKFTPVERKAFVKKLIELKRKTKKSWSLLIGTNQDVDKQIDIVMRLTVPPIQTQNLGKAKPAPVPKPTASDPKTPRDKDKVFLINTRGEYSLGGTRGCTPDINKAFTYEYADVKHLLSQGMRVVPAVVPHKKAAPPKKKPTSKKK